MAVKIIIEIGHRILKRENKPVTDFRSPKIKKLIQDLSDHNMYVKKNKHDL